MNHSYLMNYISYHLHTRVQRYTSDFGYADSFCGRLQFSDYFTPDELMSFFTSRKDIDFNIPMFISFRQQFFYALVPTPEHYFIIGPVRLLDAIYLRCQATVESVDKAWLSTVPVCSFKELFEDTLLIFNLYRDEPINESVLVTANCIDQNVNEQLNTRFSELVFENREHGKRHNPYDQELRECAAIECGDLEQLEMAIKEDFLGEYGTLAQNPVRHIRNLGIVVITLASRAAIRGGIPSETAYSFSDATIQNLEENSDIPTLFRIIRSAEFQYAQMVKDLKEQKSETVDKDKNPYVSQCKNYIFSHLHDKLFVQDIAEKLNISANYLSELFHQCEKITLIDFILREKINLVKNMLIYSRYSCSEIAAYLGFSSQSYMGKQFKARTGMTPYGYRKMYGVRNFDV